MVSFKKIQPRHFPGGVIYSVMDLSAGHGLQIERLVLEPGQSTNMHTHGLSALSVFLTTAKIRIESPGKKPETIDYKPGDFRWRAAPVTHRLKNIGSTRFEAVGIDWK